MRKPAIVAMTLVMFSLGMTLAVCVAGSASAAAPKGKKTTTTKAKAATTPTPTSTDLTTTTESPGDGFFVINGTVNAASDHERIGSSAFPNFTKGAVDNYYSLAYSHVDNSPFAEGTASPFDTGPIGQTAAAGNTQQPQYADARWPGDNGKASYGTQGQPYATAEASEYRATADASEASTPLSRPGLSGTPTLPLPKGFDGRLRQVLAGWKAKWQGPLDLTKPTPVPTPTKPPVTTPKIPIPKTGITTPTATVTTPIATVTTPTPHAAEVNPTPPPVTVPSPPLPPLPSARSKDGTRSFAAASTPADGAWLLTSSTSATLVPATPKPKADTTKTTKSKTKAKKAKAKPKKAYALVTSGESSLKRVSLGGGQIVIEGIHVTASITNDGTPSYKAATTVASASIGGVPVTIDQDGVHVVDQGQNLPYQQASDALNGALKQAGIQIFLVSPEVKKCETGGGALGGSTPTSSNDQSGSSDSCDQSGSGSTCDQSATPTGGLPGGTNTNSCDQSGGAMCDQTGSGNSTSNGTTTTTSSKNQLNTSTTTGPSCDQSGAGTSCGTAGTDTSGGTGAGAVPGIGAPTTTTTKTTTTSSKSNQHSTTTTPSYCDQSSAPSTGSCGPGGTSTTSSNDQADTTDTSTTMSSGGSFGLGGAGMPNSTEMTVTATGVHVVFTQPVNQSGVPSQNVEHILGEVTVDSLAVPAGDLPDLGLSSGSSLAGSSCLGGKSRGAASGTSMSGGGSSSAGGVGSSGSSAGSSFGSTAAQGTAGSTGNSLPVAFATALRKPLWLLLAYLVWQGLVIGTGWSLWNWRRGGAS